LTWKINIFSKNRHINISSHTCSFRALPLAHHQEKLISPPLDLVKTLRLPQQMECGKSDSG
jgi:hypothetical protein